MSYYSCLLSDLSFSSWHHFRELRKRGETGYLLQLSGPIDRWLSESRTSLRLITATELKHLTCNTSCLFKTETTKTNLPVGTVTFFIHVAEYHRNNLQILQHFHPKITRLVQNWNVNGSCSL